MPETDSQATDPQTEKKPTVEIGRRGKFIAGLTFIVLIISAIVALVAYWPDQLPKGEAPAYYKNKPFHICLLKNSCDCSLKKDSTYTIIIIDSTKANTDTSKAPLTDSQKLALAADTSKKQTTVKVTVSPCTDAIHLNTLLMILVALAGFLGSLIHIASSFTNFVGAEQYKNSWLMWYCVKPFTGAGLAVVFYFIFRAGLLSFNDPSSINLYGLITLAALTGLFTDKATLKLEEVFAVIFKPKDPRPDKLEKEMSFTGISPLLIETGKENEITISGLNLETQKLTISVNNEAVEAKNIQVSTSSIILKYSIPESQKDSKEFTISVKDEKSKELYSYVLKLKGADGTDQATETNTTNDEPAVG